MPDQRDQKKPGYVIEQAPEDVVAIQAWDQEGKPVMIQVVLCEHRGRKSRIRYVAPRSITILLNEGGADDAVEGSRG